MWQPDGSRRLHQALSEGGANQIRGKTQAEETIRKRVATRKEQGCVPPRRWDEDHSTAEVELEIARRWRRAHDEWHYPL